MGEILTPLWPLHARKRLEHYEEALKAPLPAQEVSKTAIRLPSLEPLKALM